MLINYLSIIKTIHFCNVSMRFKKVFSFKIMKINFWFCCRDQCKILRIYQITQKYVLLRNAFQCKGLPTSAQFINVE